MLLVFQIFLSDCTVSSGTALSEHSCLGRASWHRPGTGVWSCPPQTQGQCPLWSGWGVLGSSVPCLNCVTDSGLSEWDSYQCFVFSPVCGCHLHMHKRTVCHTLSWSSIRLPAGPRWSAFPPHQTVPLSLAKVTVTAVDTRWAKKYSLKQVKQVSSQVCFTVHSFSTTRWPSLPI